MATNHFLFPKRKPHLNYSNRTQFSKQGLSWKKGWDLKAITFSHFKRAMNSQTTNSVA